MRYRVRILCAVLTCLIGIGVSLVWRVSSNQPGHFTDDRIPPGDVTGKVSLRFMDCAGTRAVFLLDNGTDHRIFTRVQPAEFWQEFKEANLEFGVHKIQYRAPESKDFIDVGPRFDAFDPFQTIMPHETIRYGVDLWRGPGEYIVKVPYMEDAEVVRRLEQEFPDFLKHQFERVRAAWKEVLSDVVTEPCR